jgi:hypothetical protein
LKAFKILQLAINQALERFEGAGWVRRKSGMISFIIKVIIIYLIYRLVTILIRKWVMYYRAYKVLKQKRREQAIARKRDFNIQAFDVEDAEYEEIKPGSED